MEESDSLGTLKCRVGIKTNMEHAVAMQITGAVLVLVAAMKNRDPIGEQMLQDTCLSPKVTEDIV